MSIVSDVVKNLLLLLLNFDFELNSILIGSAVRTYIADCVYIAHTSDRSQISQCRTKILIKSIIFICFG